jgi:hypothetical protein
MLINRSLVAGIFVARLRRAAQDLPTIRAATLESVR